jgi:hypothetical protein
MAEALGTVHTHGRVWGGTSRVILASRPKVSVRLDGSNSPGNFGLFFEYACIFCQRLVLMNSVYTDKNDLHERINFLLHLWVTYPQNSECTENTSCPHNVPCTYFRCLSLKVIYTKIWYFLPEDNYSITEVLPTVYNNGVQIKVPFSRHHETTATQTSTKTQFRLAPF